MLDAMVADGTLPPVEERLSDEPLVMQPADRIGEYGGTMRNAHEGNFDFLEDLLRDFPHVYGLNMQGVWPNVFMNAETSADGLSTTFTIRPDIKWSDGDPFGADDFVFWYEAIAANAELNPNGVNNMKVGGEMGTLSKVDDNTIVMSFSAPYGVLLERLNRWHPMPYAPALSSIPTTRTPTRSAPSRKRRVSRSGSNCSRASTPGTEIRTSRPFSRGRPSPAGPACPCRSWSEIPITGRSTSSATNCPTSTASTAPIWATARPSCWMSFPARTTT